MALKVDIDIADAYVSQEAYSVLDGLVRGRDLSQFAVSNIWTPRDLAMTLQPVQLTAAWAAATGKYALSDWSLDATKWEQVQHRAASDWFISSRGLPSGTAISLTHQLATNAGLCFEFSAMPAAHGVVRDLYIVQFGLYYRLHIHSNGVADFEDTRQPALLAQNAPLTSNGQDLAGKFVQILILPWRRGRVFVWTNQGGSFEVYVNERQTTSTAAATRTPGESVYHVVTEAAAVKVTPSASCRAFWALNTIRYPAAGSVTSPVINLPTPTYAVPSSQTLQYEAQDGTSATLTITDGNGNAFAPTSTTPAQSIQFAIALTSPAAGVAPVVFGAEIAFDRALSNRVYGTNTVNVVSARLSLSRERASKSFEFTLDNPHDNFTSIKDLWNRRVKAYTTADSIDSAAAVLFEGYADPADFVDGRSSRITIPVSGLRKRLRYALMSDARSFDGWTHAAMVHQVLHDAGIDDSKIYVVDDGVTLEKADPGDDPLWRPTNGTSRDEWIQHCCDTFSGYVFDDVGGTFYYAPREYWTAAAVAGSPTIPQIKMTTPKDAITRMPSTRAPYGADLVALEVRQTAEEPKANDIWVLGKDSKTDQVIAAHYVDDDSINNRLAVNWVGERRIMVYASAGITTQATAQRALSVIANRVTQAIRTVSLKLPDYRYTELPLEGPVNIQNYGLGIITSVDADLSNDRIRSTDYVVELL